MFILATALIAAISTFRGLENTSFRLRYWFDAQAILQRREYYRVFTAAFLHADWFHFLFNFYSFYSFGRIIEQIYGTATIAIIFFASILGGSLLSLLMNRRREHRALGASGGVCGVIYASIFLLPGMGINLYFLPIPGWLYAIAFPVISLMRMRGGDSKIGHDAHLGGALTGLLCVAVLHPHVLRYSTGLFYGVLAILSVILVVLLRDPLFLQSPLKSVGLDLGADAPYRPSIRYQRYDEAAQRNARNAELDQILDKVSAKGLHSLNRRERQRLEELSAK